MSGIATVASGTIDELIAMIYHRLWAVFAIMLFTDLAIIGWNFTVPKGRRVFHQLAIIILTTAAVVSHRMFGPHTAKQVSPFHNRPTSPWRLTSAQPQSLPSSMEMAARGPFGMFDTSVSLICQSTSHGRGILQLIVSFCCRLGHYHSRFAPRDPFRHRSSPF